MSFSGQHIRGLGSLAWIWVKKGEQECKNPCHYSQKLWFQLHVFIRRCVWSAHGCLNVQGYHSHHSHHQRTLPPHPLQGLFRHLFLNYGCFSFLKIKPLHYIVLLEVQNFKQFPFFFFAHFTFVISPLSTLTPNSPLLCQRAFFAPTVSSNLTSHLKFHLKFLASPCIPYSFLPRLPFI